MGESNRWNNYAISTSDLATSLTKSSGSLVAANGTLEEAVALTATANTIIQDADVVGTALKTVAMRLRGTDTKTMEEEGLDTDGAVTSKSKLQGKIKALSGVDILTDAGAYKSTYQILSEIAEVWEDIDDMDQAALLELLAGKRAGSVMSAILQNPETLKDAFESANNAAGSAWDENEKYLDSIQGKMDLFTNSIQTMWINAMDDDVVKGFVDFGRVLIEIVDNIGLLKTLLIALGTYAGAKHFNGNLFGGIFGGMFADKEAYTIPQVKQRLDDLRKSMEDAKAELNKSPADKSRQRKYSRAEKRYNKYNDEVSPQIKKYEDLTVRQKQAQDNYNKAFSDMNRAIRTGADSTTIEAYGNNVKNAKLELDQVNAQLKDFQILTKDSMPLTTRMWNGIKTGAKTAAKAIGKVGQSLLQSYVMMEAMSLLFKTLDSIFSGIGKKWPKTADQVWKEFEELNAELDSAESKLKDLEGELDTINDRIDELMSKGSLSFTDQEELDKLRSQSEELKTQISLAKTLRDNLQISVNQASINAVGKYLRETSFASKSTESERVEAAGDTGQSMGTTAGYALGKVATKAISKGIAEGGKALGGKIGSVLGSVAPGVGNVIGLVGGTVIGGLVGKAIGKFVAGKDYEGEQTVQEALDNMETEREKLQKAQIEAYKAYADNPVNDKLAETFDNASDKLSEYDQNMAKHISNIQEAYNAINISQLDLTKDADKAILLQKQRIGDILDKYNIIMGGDDAKSNAISRILGSAEADDELSAIDKKLKDIMKSQHEVNELSKEYNNLVNGNVDYSKRPFVSPEDMKEHWKSFDGEVATTWDIDETYGDGEGGVKYTIKFTPIMEDGTVLDKHTYAAYVQNIFNQLDESNGDINKALKYDAAHRNIIINWQKGAVDYDDEGYSELDRQLDEIKQKHWDITQSTEDFDRALKNSFNTDEEYDAFVKRLEEIGITVTDLKYYYLDFAKTENEVKSDTYEVVKSVSSLTDGISALKDAFGEFRENGLITADTLVELYETFGQLGDEWKNYVDIMATGTKSTKQAAEATSQLLEAFMNGKLSQGPIKDMKEYLTLMSQLAKLGVSNPKEYIDALQKSQMMSGIATDVTSQYEKLKELQKQYDEGKITEKEYNTRKEELSKTRGDFIQKYEDEYGITLTDDERFGVAKAILVEKKKKELEVTQKNANEYQIQSRQKEEADRLKKLKQEELKYAEESAAAYKEAMTAPSVTSEQQLQLKPLYDEQIKQVNTLKDEISNIPDVKITVPVTTQDDVEKVKSELNKAEEEWQKFLDESGLKVQIELVEATQLVDDIQGVYDTLMKAKEEYAENGYLSVDTMQELLTLEPKYLAMLFNEKGQLNLNRDAILEVAQARLFDMTQKQIDNIITNASKAAKNGEIEKLKELTDVLYDAADAQRTFNTSKMEELRINLAKPELGLSEAEQKAYADKVQNQVNSVISAYNVTVANLPKALRSGGGNSGDDDRLEKLQKKYEGKISNLENQKTWLENEIEREEEIGVGVSKAYYEEQIKINDKLSEQYEKQRKDLIDLRKVYPEGSEKWYEVSEAIWEIDHALQELTTDSIKASKSIIDLFTDAFEKIGEAFSDKSNISEKLIASMEGYAELLDLRGGTATKGLFDAMIAEYDTQLATKWEQFNSQYAVYEALLAKRSEYTPDSAEWIYYNQQVIKTHNELMGVKEEIQDIEIAQEQKKDEFKELATQRWDDVQEAYANRDQYYQNQIDLNDKYISKLETLGINVPDEAYQTQIDSLGAASASKWKQYLQARQEMIDYEGIYGADSQEYIDKYNETIQLHHEYLDKENEILAKQQQIFDNQIDRFNQVIDRINNSTKRMQNISSLVEDEDVATEDGEWTSEGITRLGMAYHQMEYYKQSADEVAKKMKEVERAYKRGEISEKKYYETMQELENQQWELINSYKDMEDAIVDINEARIDMIEEGLDKEIEAYEELIDLKKEELDAERDLFDFKKDVEKQTKDIAALERRIASMGGSSDASTIAERTKLEAELREAKDELDGSYRDHAYDSMGNALDDELDAYTKNSEDYIKSLRESIKDTDLLIEQTYQKVVQNSSMVIETIYGLSETYKFPIDQNLTSPWENATQKSLDFETYAKGHINNIYNYVESMKGSLAKSLGDPYDSLTTDDMGNPLYEFSWYAAKQIDTVIDDAVSEQDRMKTALDGGFTQAQSSIQGWGTTASNSVQNVIDKFTGENGLLAALNKTAEKINTMPNYDGGYTAPNTSGTGNGGKTYTGGGLYNDPKVTALQEILNDVFNAGISEDGDWGPKTEAALKKAKGTMSSELNRLVGNNGKYDKVTQNSLTAYIDKKIKSMQGFNGSSMIGQGLKVYQEAKKKIPIAFHAKGTLGTTRDQLAITDESWIGEEITLAAGKNGQLQYLKKGSAVMPADISANLVEWGKLNPNMMKIDGGANLNMISNAVNKPELNFSFDSLVHVDNCSQDTLKDLERMVDTKINQFNKQLNQSLRKFK